jgi:hypothetical protein
MMPDLPFRRGELRRADIHPGVYLPGIGGKHLPFIFIGNLQGNLTLSRTGRAAEEINREGFFQAAQGLGELDGAANGEKTFRGMAEEGKSSCRWAYSSNNRGSVPRLISERNCWKVIFGNRLNKTGRVQNPPLQIAYIGKLKRLD